MKSLEPLTHSDLNDGFCAFTSAPCKFLNQAKGFRALDLQGHGVSQCNASSWESTKVISAEESKITGEEERYSKLDIPTFIATARNSPEGRWQGNGITTSAGIQNALTGLAASIGLITVFSAVIHGMLSRFPDVKLASIENGAMWVPDLLRNLKDARGKMPFSFKEHPVDQFREQVQNVE